jgi:hypothetical protein
MPITGTILEVPTAIPTLGDSCLPFLTAMNQAWWNNAMKLGWFSLAVGFLIGIVAGYYYCKGKYGEIEYGDK